MSLLSPEKVKARNQAIWISLFAAAIAFLTSLEPSLFGGIRWNLTLLLWAVSAILPILAAYLLRGRKGDWGGYNYLLIIAVGAVCASTYASKQPRESADERMGRIMREAVGLQAVKNHDVEEEAVRNLFKDIVSETKQIRSNYDSADLSDLYQPKTFADTESIEAELQQIDRFVNANDKATHFFSDFPELARRDLARADVDRLKVDAFSRLAVEKLAPSALPPVDYLQKEGEWATGTKELYEFAREHANAFGERDGRITVNDPTVLAEFNQRWDESLANRRKMQEAREASAKYAQSAMQRFGINPEALK